MKKYSKFLIAALGALVQVAVTQYGTNHYVQMVVAVLTALGVYQVKNQ